MGSFTNGVLVGLGISLLFAPMKGEEMRRMLAERIRYARSTGPESPQLKQSAPQMSEPVQVGQGQANLAAPMRTAAQEYGQQIPTSANAVQGDLSSLGQQTTTNPPLTRQGNTDPTTPL
jgi:gas vesicle protein